MLIFIALAAGAATTLSIVFAFQYVTAPSRIVRARLAGSGSDLGVRSASVLRTTRTRIPFADRLPLSHEARERLDLELQRAGQPLLVSEYLALRVGCAALGGLVGFFIVAGIAGLAGAPAALIAVPLVLTGWMLPRAYLSQARKRRLRQIETQLPGALTSIAKALRAGSGLLHAVGYAADETPAPLGAELKQLLSELQLGADPEQSFGALAWRVGSPDLDIAVSAIVIQRTVGGNLSEILANVSDTITQRRKLLRDIEVITSKQKLLANLSAALPVLIAIAFVTLNPQMGELLIDTTPGRIALAIGIGFELLGIWLVRRLSVIEV